MPQCIACSRSPHNVLHSPSSIMVVGLEHSQYELSPNKEVPWYTCNTFNVAILSIQQLNTTQEYSQKNIHRRIFKFYTVARFSQHSSTKVWIINPRCACTARVTVVVLCVCVCVCVCGFVFSILPSRAFRRPMKDISSYSVGNAVKLKSRSL